LVYVHVCVDFSSNYATIYVNKIQACVHTKHNNVHILVKQFKNLSGGYG
jgi:hypothetical protein